MIFLLLLVAVMVVLQCRYGDEKGLGGNLA